MRSVVHRLSAVAAIGLVSSAHVGSPDAWFEGAAGPYRVTVHLQAPPVVPGIAIVSVRTADSVERVTAFVNTFDAEGGTPPPDELTPSADRPGWRSARLWVMNAGSNRVTVAVHGAHGPGTVVVPLAAIAQRRLTVTPLFTAMVVLVAIVLMAGILTLVGAAVREGALDPGLLPDETRRRRARMAMARASVIVLLVLAGTTLWWRSEDRAFQARLYRPLSVTTRVITSSGAMRFVLEITDSTWRRDDVALLRARGEAPSGGLIGDHGKLMHLFLVAESGGAMAHLHPATGDTVTFTSALPPLPGGSYRVFADIVQQSGFTQTLTSTVPVPDAVGSAFSPTDADDSWGVAAESISARVTLEDGARLTWLREPGTTIRAGEEAGLRFRLDRPDGDTASLQSYLGMPGHAAVVRDDGQVFIHLHPMGTISPAAQARLTPASSVEGQHQMSMGALSDSLRFPYAFPEPGRYMVWVQIKRHDRIHTAAFRTVVE